MSLTADVFERKKKQNKFPGHTERHIVETCRFRFLEMSADREEKS